MPLFASTHFVRLLSGRKEEPLPRFAAPAIEVCDHPESSSGSAAEGEGLLLVDARGRISAADEGFSSLLGYGGEEVVGKRYTRLFTPLQVRSQAPELAFILANKEGRNVGPVWRCCKSGEVVPFQSRLEALYDERGTVRSHLESLEGARKSASEPPATTGPREAVFLIEQGRISLAGCDAARLTGLPLAETIGQEWDFLFCPMGPEERAAFSGALLGGLAWSGKSRMKVKGGEDVSVLCRLLPLDAGEDRGKRAVMKVSLLPDAGEYEGETNRLAMNGDEGVLPGAVRLRPREGSLRAGTRPGSGNRIEESFLQAATLVRHLLPLVGGKGAPRSGDVPQDDGKPRREGVPFFREWSEGKAKAQPGASLDYSLVWPAGKETILLLDDNVSTRRLLSASLRTLGYRIIEVGDRDAALAVIQGEGTIDVLVADMVLPSGNGWEIGTRFRECHERGRVLYISGHSMNPKIGDLLRNEPFLAKPFTPLCLARKIREILGPGRKKV